MNTSLIDYIGSTIPPSSLVKLLKEMIEATSFAHDVKIDLSKNWSFFINQQADYTEKVNSKKQLNRIYKYFIIEHDSITNKDLEVSEGILWINRFIESEAKSVNKLTVEMKTTSRVNKFEVKISIPLKRIC